MPLKNTFVLTMTDVGQDTYDAMINGDITDFVAEGSITTETSWSIVEKEFRTELE